MESTYKNQFIFKPKRILRKSPILCVTGHKALQVGESSAINIWNSDVKQDTTDETACTLSLQRY